MRLHVGTQPYGHGQHAVIGGCCPLDPFQATTGSKTATTALRSRPHRLLTVSPSPPSWPPPSLYRPPPFHSRMLITPQKVPHCALATAAAAPLLLSTTHRRHHRSAPPPPSLPSQSRPWSFPAKAITTIASLGHALPLLPRPSPAPPVPSTATLCLVTS